MIEWLAVDCKNASDPWHSSHEIKIDKLGYITIDGKKNRQFWDGASVSEQQPRRIKIRNIAGDETIKTIDGKQLLKKGAQLRELTLYSEINSDKGFSGFVEFV